jgi:hypothetical protein
LLVDLVLGLVGVAFSISILGVLIWAFTRPGDRIQLATACLFLSALVYFGDAAQLYGQGAYRVAVVVGVYTVLLYVTTGVLAISHKRWAWQAAVAAFSVQLGLGLIFPFTSMANGIVVFAGLAAWLVVGAVGIWACLHSGSRQVVLSANAGHA